MNERYANIDPTADDNVCGGGMKEVSMKATYAYNVHKTIINWEEE